MKARLSLIVAVVILALSFVAQALAVGEPDQISPAEGAAFTAGDQIIFTASPTNGATPPQMDFYIWENHPGTPPGAPTGFRDHFEGGQTSDPTVYAGTPNPNEGWPNRPGTYFWQAVYHDCLQNPAESCFVKSGIRSLIINPLPASAVVSAVQIETFLDYHPRHKTRKRRVKFRFSSNVAGASFQCLFAQGWDDCQSPTRFRRLKPGRYRFKARAVVNGLEDPSPVSWVFRILRRRN